MSNQPNRTEFAEEVVRLLRLTDRRKLSAEEAAEVVADYVSILQELPIGVVRAAIMRFAKGHVGSKAFAPTPAELFAEADRIYLAQLIAERQKVLPPPIKEVSDEVRARTKQKIEGLLSELKEHEKETIDAEKAIHRKAIAEMAEWDRKKIIAECEANGVDAFDGGPFPVSMALRRLISQQGPPSSPPNGREETAA